MNKLALMLWALTLGLGRAADGNVEPPIDPETFSLLGKSYDKALDEVRELDEPKRKHLLSEFKRYIASDPIRAERARDLDRQLLFILRDEEIVREDVKNFVEGRGTSFSWLYNASKNPKFIEMLAPALVRDDPPESLQQPSLVVMGIIRRILESTPGFSPEVYNWVNDYENFSMGVVKEREMFRKWWRENEPFFKAGDYQAVKPGPSVEKEPTRAAAPAQEVPTATSASPATATPAATLAKAPELASEKQITPWLWIVGILGAFRI